MNEPTSDLVLLNKLLLWWKTRQPDHELDEECRRIFQRFRNALVRGAAAGGVLRGGLHLFSYAMRLVSKRNHQAALPLKGVLKDTTQWMAFLGCLGGAYVAVDEGLAAVFGKRRTSGWRALVAGAIAGPCILLTGSKVRHDSLAIYVFVRSLTLLVRCGNKPDAPATLRYLLTPTRMEHGDTLLMCAAASQILYSYVCVPQTLPNSYVRFLFKQGAKEQYVWNAIRETISHNATQGPPRPLACLQATPLAHHCSHIPCNVIHPGQTCPEHFFRFIWQGYPRALRVYVPVYLLPAILVHRRKVLQEPARLGGKVAEGVARSGLFLVLYIALAFAGACSCHQLTGTSSGPLLASFLWLPGLATLVEKKSRRMELALYCVARAVESYGRCLVEWGWVQPKQVPVRLDVVLFSAAVGIIMHCYSDAHGKHRDVFRSKYLNILDAVFGNAGVSEGCIKHVPSNADILQGVQTRAARAIRSLGSSGNLTLLAAPSAPLPDRYHARLGPDSTAHSAPLPEQLGVVLEHHAGPDAADIPAAEAARAAGESPFAAVQAAGANGGLAAHSADAAANHVDTAPDNGRAASGRSTPAGGAAGAKPGSDIPGPLVTPHPSQQQAPGKMPEGTAAQDASTHPNINQQQGLGKLPEGAPAQRMAGVGSAASLETYASARETLETWSSGSLLDVPSASASSEDAPLEAAEEDTDWVAAQATSSGGSASSRANEAPMDGVGVQRSTAAAAGPGMEDASVGSEVASCEHSTLAAHSTAQHGSAGPGTADAAAGSAAAAVQHSTAEAAHSAAGAAEHSTQSAATGTAGGGLAAEVRGAGKAAVAAVEAAGEVIRPAALVDLAIEEAAAGLVSNGIPTAGPGFS